MAYFPSPCRYLYYCKYIVHVHCVQHSVYHERCMDIFSSRGRTRVPQSLRVSTTPPVVIRSAFTVIPVVTDSLEKNVSLSSQEVSFALAGIMHKPTDIKVSIIWNCNYMCACVCVYYDCYYLSFVRCSFLCSLMV